jgi:hypothetical protein
MHDAPLPCCFNQVHMSISKDTLWKGIIENLVDDFIRYFFPNYFEEIDFERGFEFLDTELQKLMPDNPAKSGMPTNSSGCGSRTGRKLGF